MSQNSWFSWFASVIIVAGITTLAFLITGSKKSFPALPQGSFVGQISGFTSSQNDQATLYVERVADANSLLLVIFVPGWHPQIVPMERAYDEGAATSDTLTEELPLRPVVLQHDGIVYTLTGKKDFNQFSGEVESSAGTRGVWNIRPITVEELNSGSSELTLDEKGLMDWLNRKAQFRDLKRTLSETSTKLDVDRGKLTKLKEFIVDEKRLTERATQRREALTAELEDARGEKEKAAQDVNALIAELEMLGRITKRGKAITLARQVAYRENKWYSVNWSAQEDTAGLEEFASTTAGIDLRALEQELKLAKEKRALQRQIADERIRIADLKRQISGIHDEDQTEAAPGSQSGHSGRRSSTPQPSFWDKLWSTP